MIRFALVVTVSMHSSVVVLAQDAGTTIRGVVFDSIARAPLPGSIVQVVSNEGAARYSRSTVADSLGRYAIEGVPAGRYVVGFVHAMLDSLGIEAPLRQVTISGGQSITVDLAIPSASRVRSAICGTTGDSAPGGVLIGMVRDARDGTPVGGALVTTTWLELSLSRAGMSGRVPSQSDTTRANGWFALCNVPNPGTMTVAAARGAKSTDRFEVEMTDGLLRRMLFVGEERDQVPGDSRRQRAGEGTLRGQVVAAANDRPLAGARVAILDGPSTTTNERGEWTLTGTPTGTRVLQVRAVGYYPSRASVDVIEGTPAVWTALPTMKAILDTVRVTASRLTSEESGFEERRRMGNGRYITTDDVDRRRPIVTSDLFRTVAGLRVEDTGEGKRLFMPGTFSERCEPAVYLDGRYFSILNAEEIDNFVRPEEVAGIEVYAGASLPVQFSRGLAGVGRAGDVCGSIVIWTRPSPARLQRTSWRHRVLTVLGLGAVAVMVGVFFDRP